MKKIFSLTIVVAVIMIILPIKVFSENETSPIYEIGNSFVWILNIKLNKDGNSVNVSRENNVTTISLLADFNGAMVFTESGNYIIEANGYNFITKKSSNPSIYSEISPIMILSANTTVRLKNGGTYKAYCSSTTILCGSYDNSKLIIENAKIMRGEKENQLYIPVSGGCTFILGAEESGSSFLINGKEYTTESRPEISDFVYSDIDVIPITDDGRLSISHRSYLFSIPASVNFRETAEIKLENITLASGQEAIVRITSTSDSENMLKLKNEDNEEFEYKISNALNSIQEFGVGDVVLRIDSTNTAKSGSVNLKFEETSKISYTGDYSGKINFGVSIEYKEL